MGGVGLVVCDLYVVGFGLEEWCVVVFLCVCEEYCYEVGEIFECLYYFFCYVCCLIVVIG